MIPDTYLLAAVIVCAAITVALRAMPFAVAQKLQQHRIGDNLSRWMPAGCVLILAIYCLAEIGDTTTTRGVAEVAGTVTVVVLHLWKRNMLVSIVVGTAVCVALAGGLPL
jgi:branched-subunit amino acid transport protein AzlD